MAPPPSFEMADVHISPHSDNPSLRIFRREGRYELLGATMVDLISTAYGVKPAMVTGGPDWLESDRFDVIAKASPDLDAEALRTMLQTLLADRFHVATHKGTGLRAALVLTAQAHQRIKQSDGSGAAGCQDQPAEHSPTINGVLACHNITMAAFAELLQTNSAGPVKGYIAGYDVVDQTSLQGTWDFILKWAGGAVLRNAGLEGVTLFDAIDKQLGLKLTRGQASLPVIVVDSVNQTPTANLPGITEKLPELKLEFDVADIRPSAQSAPTAPKFTPGGGMDVRGVTLIALIQHAWGIDSYDNELIVGAPRWLTSERYDILAKATPPEGPASALKDDDSLRAMLRNLLIDRFRLALHEEEKPATVYTLVAGKPAVKQADPGSRSKCTEEAATAAITVAGIPQRTIGCMNTTPAQFAERLRGMAPGYIHRPVVDATGIRTAFDFSLVYSRPDAIRAAIVRGDGEQGAAAPDGSTSLFEALEKQTGFKLTTEKRPMPVLVIDHVEQKPTDN